MKSFCLALVTSGLLAFTSAAPTTAEETPTVRDLRPNETVEYYPGIDMGFIPFKPERLTRSLIPTYYLSTAAANYFDAFRYCRLTGRQLLTIHNDLEQFEVELLLQRRNLVGNVWLGAFCNQGCWYWESDLQPVSRLFNKLENGDVECGDTDDVLLVNAEYERSWVRFQWRQEKPRRLNYFVCTSDR